MFWIVAYHCVRLWGQTASTREPFRLFFLQTFKTFTIAIKSITTRRIKLFNRLQGLTAFYGIQQEPSIEVNHSNCDILQTFKTATITVKSIKIRRLRSLTVFKSIQQQPLTDVNHLNRKPGGFEGSVYFDVRTVNQRFLKIRTFSTFNSSLSIR